MASIYHTLVAQAVKRLPTMWGDPGSKTRVSFPLEKKMATHSSTLA